MNWRRPGPFVMAACLGCSSVSGPANSIGLLDGRGETISVGPVTLTAKASSAPYITPGGSITGPAIGLDLEITKSPPDTTKPLLTCYDVRVYTQSSGGSLVYSQNQVRGEKCSGPMNGFSSGPSGVTQGIGVVTALRDADVVPMLTRGTYYVRFRVTFPDSSVAEVRAGTIVRD